MSRFAADVARDLQRTPKQLQAQYFYDALGSSLFEAICRLPWYRITRAEGRLLADHGPAIAARLPPAGAAGLSIVELGAGSGEKLAALLGALPPGARACVHLIDISEAALDAAAARLAGMPGVSVARHQGTYEQGLEALGRTRGEAGATLGLLLGSNIGNFDAQGARGLLGALRAALGRGSRLLLGADLVKPAGDLVRAYDDPLGVTAAFNKNLLVRINMELGGSFDLALFEHRAVWNAAEQRVEMHLVSRVAQEVRIPGAQVRITLAAGESIWTESSYKYSAAGVTEMAREAGWDTVEQWIEEDSQFALTLLGAR